MPFVPPATPDRRSRRWIAIAARAASPKFFEPLEARQFLSVSVPGFLAPTTISTGATPTAVVTDDFNQDGNEDIAVAQSNNTIAILLGNGDGTFSAPTQFATGADPTSIAVGDFNNDGADDLVTADAGSGDVSILLQNTDSDGNALGTFSGPHDIHIEPPGGGSMSVAVGDFNNDGNLDIAVAGKNGLYVLSGNGDGTFSAPQRVAGGDFSGGVVADCFTNSGNTDLAALNPAANAVEVFPGNGDGTFAAPAPYSVSAGATSIASGDLNDDGAEDIAVTIPSQNAVEVLFQNTTTVTVPEPTLPPIVNPGGPMIPVASSPPVNLTTTTVGSGSGSTGDGGSYTYQEGAGTFAAPTTIQLDQSPSSLVLADVTGSYNTDVVTANTANNSLTVIPGNGDGTFGTPVDIAVGTSPVAAAVDDFNNDGGSDLLSVNAGSNSASVVLQQSSDVAVTLASSSANATFGSNLTYTAIITNNGPGIATDVSFDDYLPSNFSLVSATSSQGTVDTTTNVGDVNASIGDLASGATATVSIVVNPTQYGPATNSVYVNSDSVDSNYDNNNASVNTPVVGATGAEVALTDSGGGFNFFPPVPYPVAASGTNTTAANTTTVKTTVASKAATSAMPIWFGGGARIGQDYSYTFTINNYGPDAASGLNFTDALPTNATFVSATASQGTTDSSTPGTLNASIGDLASGASATVTITVKPTAVGELTSAASVTATTPDPYLADNSDTFSTYVYSDKGPFPVLDLPTGAAGSGASAAPTAPKVTTGLPILSVSGAKQTIPGKGQANCVFTVTRTGNLTAASTVSYSTVSGSAKAGVNFKSVSGQLTFAAGAASQTVTVPVMGSKKSAGSHAFVLSLSHPSNATLKKSRATGTLVGAVKTSKGKSKSNPFAKGIGINFEPAGGPAIKGYLEDAGSIFGARTDGLTFGWSSDNTANAVQRHVEKDPKLDTFNVLGQGGASNWEISLPNGRYSIKLTAGDPTNTTNSYAVDANGNSILTGTASGKHPFVTANAKVTVSNGVLTLTPGSNAVSDDLDFLKIKFLGA